MSDGKIHDVEWVAEVAWKKIVVTYCTYKYRIHRALMAGIGVQKKIVSRYQYL